LIVGWLQAVCEPLAYLHDKGTVHLNIKPANIRLTPAGEVFLVDTGLPGLGIHVGTGGYASPEQARQEAATAASDIYSLGATLYTLLTGHAPPEALRRESGLHTLEAPREANPDVEPYLSLAAMRALDMRPDVRFESVDDFAQAMERPIGRAAYQPSGPRRTPSSQAASPPPPRLPRRIRRQMQQRTILGMVALMLVTAVGVAAIFLLSGQFQLANQEPEAATATTQSEIIAALTQLAPTITPSPPPTDTPEPTPAPLLDTRTGARLLYVPGGVFRYGDDEGEDDETPSNVIRVDAFFIDETEVSNGQYQLCVESGACNPPLNTGATFHPAYFGDPNFDNYPVIFVNWNNADAFCQWRNARLPTEAE
jgi:serine/threonine-protein kinase